MTENEIDTIKEVIVQLQHVGCVKKECPGWEEPFDVDKTCYVCSSIQDLFTLLRKKGSKK